MGVSCGCWEQNLGPQEEQHFLTTEPPLGSATLCLIDSTHPSPSFCVFQVNIQHSLPTLCSLLGIQYILRPYIFLRLRPTLMLHLRTQSSIVQALFIQELPQSPPCQLHSLAPLCICLWPSLWLSGL